MRYQWDATIAGDHQPQPDQPQVGTLLLGLAPLRDGRLGVGRVDERGEVGHVQRQRGHVHTELVNDPYRQPLLDDIQLLRCERMHRVPEPAMFQHPGRDLGEPLGGGALPPVGERPLRTRVDHPVQRRQRQIRAHTGAGIGAPRPHHLVDEAGHAQPAQHRPHRRHIPKRQMTKPLRQHLPLAGIQQCLNLGGSAHVALRGQLRLAINPRHLAQVPVRLPTDDLLVQTCHHFRS
jgi:hypothetical protein